MSPNTDVSAASPVSPQDTLRELQRAWTAVPPPSPSKLTPAAHRQPLRSSFLSLRDIPQFSYDDSRGVFPMLDPGFPEDWKEQIRQLRNRLTTAQSELQRTDEPLQIVSFTNLDGRRSRHGTTANLALAMASIHDTRVLLIDANLSAPTLHTALGVLPSPGLCEATRADRIALPPCFRRITGTQIYLLTLGDIHTYPADPLDLEGLRTLLPSLRSQFDWIFIDSPGFDTAADTVAISSTADGVIMVIESERDNYRNVAGALNLVQGRRMLGAVMF